MLRAAPEPLEPRVDERATYRAAAAAAPRSPRPACSVGDLLGEGRDLLLLLRDRPCGASRRPGRPWARRRRAVGGGRGRGGDGLVLRRPDGGAGEDAPPRPGRRAPPRSSGPGCRAQSSSPSSCSSLVVVLVLTAAAGLRRGVRRGLGGRGAAWVSPPSGAGVRSRLLRPGWAPRRGAGRRPAPPRSWPPGPLERRPAVALASRSAGLSGLQRGELGLQARDGWAGRRRAAAAVPRPRATATPPVARTPVAATLWRSSSRRSHVVLLVAVSPRQSRSELPPRSKNRSGKICPRSRP